MTESTSSGTACFGNVPITVTSRNWWLACNMGKYLIIQVKRIGRLFPVLLLVAALLLAGAYGAYQGLLHKWEQGQVFQKVQIGVVGTDGDSLLQRAVDAVKSMDSSGMSLDFVTMSEQQAKSSLETGDISAYVVIPDGFLDAALGGNITPVRFVSVPGSENIFSIVKDELTDVVAEMLLLSEQGSFALELALVQYGHSDISGEAMNRLALEYAGKILHRDDVYRVEEIGVWQGLSFENNLICGLYTLFVFLMALPFAAVFVRDRWDVEWVLKSRGIGVFQQMLCQFVLYFVVLTVLCVPGFCLFAGIENILYLLPGILCITALSYLIYSLSGELISGVMLQLTISLGLCFICGCMYPVHFFPASVQKISVWLPAALVRTCMTGAFSSGSAGNSGWILLGISAGIFLLTFLVRSLRMVYTKGVRI